MNPMHQEFQFEGRQLEVTADPSPNRAAWTVRVLDTGRPATATAYTVTYLTMFDTQIALNAEAIKDLMNTARRAVEMKWDRLVD